MRTLALAYKDLDEDMFAEWKQRHHVASTAMDDREEKLDAIYEEIEKDLIVSQHCFCTSSTVLACEDFVYQGVSKRLLNIPSVFCILYIIINIILS